MKNLIIILLFSSLLIAQKRILIDENFDDWSDVTTMHADPIGDNTGGTFDFGTLWVTNDDEYIYFRIQTTEQIVLVNGNYMTIYVDTDDNPSTGKSINGIGAEFEYTFGSRRGKSYLGSTKTIYHEDLGFFGAPTFSGNDFEFVFRRDSQISGSPLFTSSTIKIVMYGYETDALVDFYDMLPNTGTFEYTFQSGDVDPLPAYSIKKTGVGYLRVMAYNVEQDGIIDNEKTTEFSHIFKTVEPDIIGIVESYDASSQQVADRIEFFLPSGDGQNWYNKKEGAYDIVLVSRFKIKESFTIESEFGHDASGAFLLDLRPKYDTDMFVIVSHPKCCSGSEEDMKRQNQFDAIIATIRDAVNNGGQITIQPNIPIVVMGDMNLVGDKRQYTTLITGNIFYNNTYGDDFAPDWDGGNLDDARPFASNTNLTYTTNEGSFPPGRLDFLVYSGSVMKVVNSYIFDTGKLTNDQLSEYGLSNIDTQVSDHLPVVVDFDLSPVTDVKKKDELPTKFGLTQNYPNPFNPTTTIKYTIGTPLNSPLSQRGDTGGLTKLIVYNILGQQVKILVNEAKPPGNYEVIFDASQLTSGVYFYRITSGSFMQTKKMMLIK